MKKVYSHCLAYGTTVTAKNLRAHLKHSKKLGYKGMVIVAALIDKELVPARLAEIFYEEGMETLICGFVPGGGPDPFTSAGEPQVIESLYKQMLYVKACHKVGVGPNAMIGPIHTWHMNHRDGKWDEKDLVIWLSSLQRFAERCDTEIWLEALNGTEDATPDAFHTLYRLIASHNRLYLHWDTGHAHWWNLNAVEMVKMAEEVRYLEFANVGRNPLDMPLGIEFGKYAEALAGLSSDILVGDEPFDPTVITAFGLQALCDTQVPGDQCLVADAQFLQHLGVMEPEEAVTVA
jgi:sugar phosphate isomerase/epimerase